MSEEFQFKISIPTDDSGHSLLKCSHCGSFFKITPTDFKDDGILEIHCPSCGLTSDNYITEDVLELAIRIVKNKTMDMIYDEFRKMEIKSKKGPITFKTGKRPKEEPESPIRSEIEALEITRFICCKRTTKIKPILKITGCYCPFCGVKNYEVE